MSSEKSLALKISEIEERLENKSVYSENKRTLNRNFGSVTVPSGESRLALKFFAEQSGPVALDLFLNAGAERSCEVSLVADDAVLERMCPSIKYSERARKNFYCAAGEHTLEICFVNREAAFSLFPSPSRSREALPRTQVPLRPFACREGESISPFGRRRRQDFRRNAWRAEKLFGQSGQNCAFRRGRSRAVLRFRRQNSLSERIRSDSGGNACLKCSGFCIYAYIRKRGSNVFHSRQKAFQDDNKFSNGEATASQETAVDASFSDKATRVRVPTDENGDSVLVVQRQSGLYVNGARLRLSGLTDAVLRTALSSCCWKKTAWQAWHTSTGRLSV